MTPKMIARKENYAGHERPKLAVRVPVNMPDSRGKMAPAGFGIFPVGLTEFQLRELNRQRVSRLVGI